jgi:hypothetical protein
MGHVPHLPHTCASVLLENGKTIRQMSDWLGHGDPSFTLKRYVHVMDDGLGSADFLDSVFGRSGSMLAQPPVQPVVSSHQAVENDGMFAEGPSIDLVHEAQ